MTDRTQPEHVSLDRTDESATERLSPIAERVYRKLRLDPGQLPPATAAEILRENVTNLATTHIRNKFGIPYDVAPGTALYENGILDEEEAEWLNRHAR